MVCWRTLQVRLYEFKKDGEIFKRKFNGSCTVIMWLPLKVDPSGQSVVVGFRDGVIRVLTKTRNKWRLTLAVKPHKVRHFPSNLTLQSPFVCKFHPTLSDVWKLLQDLRSHLHWDRNCDPNHVEFSEWQSQG